MINIHPCVIRAWYVSTFILFCCSCNNNPQKEFSHHTSNSKTPDSLYAKADTSYYQGKYKQAIGNYKKATKAYENVLDTNGVTKSLNDIGLSFRKLGIYDSARHYYQKALILDSIKRDTNAILGRLRNIGITYSYEGKYANSIYYYIASLELAETIGSWKNVAALNNSLGNLYSDQERYEQALENYKESLEAYKELNEPKKLALVYNNLGNLYISLQDYGKALEYHQWSLELKKSLNNEEDIAYSLHNIGVAFIHQNEFEKAEEYLKEAFTMRENLGDLRGLASTSNELSNLYLRQKEPIKALQYLEGTERYWQNSDNKTLKRDNLKNWSTYYLAVNDYKRAYSYLKDWSTLNDSLFNKEKVNVLETWNEFELQQKERVAVEQRKRADLQGKIAKNWSVFFWSLLALTLIVGGLMVLLLIQRKKILKLNAYLDTLNVEIRHGKSNDYTRVLKELNNLDISSASTIENMLFASVAVDDFIYKTQKNQVNLEHHLNKALNEKYEALFLDQKVKMEKDIQPVEVSGIIASRITFILCELMTNSSKHATKTDKSLHMAIWITQKKGLIIEYRDNGELVTQEQLENSSGQGWKIISQFVEQLQADLSLSREEHWNVFRIFIK